MKRTPDHQKLAKNRLVPYKILTMLLWHEYSWATWESDTVARIKTGPMARQMQLSNGKLREHFDWLTVHGYFAEVSTDYGVALITIGSQKRGKGPAVDWADPALPGQLEAAMKAGAAVSVVATPNPEFEATLDAMMKQHKAALDALAPTDTAEYEKKRLDKPKTMW